MSYQWSGHCSGHLSGRRPARFPFWSGSEILRVSAIAGLAIVPVSVVAIDGSGQKRRDGVEAAIVMAPLSPGWLRSVRVVDFDVRTLDLKTVGDRD